MDYPTLPIRDLHWTPRQDGAGSLGISDLLWALWTMLSKGLGVV